VNDINETQHCTVDFPIIADDSREVSALYDMIHPNASLTFTVRSLFIIGPDKKVKLFITYPASTGRNFVEVLRVIDSLQLTANHSVATPADWKNGEDVIVVPAISTEDAVKKFPKGLNVVKPYLRYTPQP
jgi:alkyl hydroperoxide reductase subunit AhpC